MQFKLTYTVTKTITRTFEIPDGASDEEYDAMKETVIAGITGNPDTHAIEGTVKVERIDTPAKEQPKYEINKDAVD